MINWKWGLLQHGSEFIISWNRLWARDAGPRDGFYELYKPKDLIETTSSAAVL